MCYVFINSRVGKIMATNYVIYNRNNYNLGLGNHIDKDGDLDSQYALLRNVGLSGKMVNGKFVSNHKKHFYDLVECAQKGCPICNGIFVDVKNKNYNIKPFYMERVVKLESKKVVAKPKTTMWDKLAKDVTHKDIEHEHPLMSDILRIFKGRKVK